LKSCIDISVLGFVPTDGSLESLIGSEDTEYLAVNVVDSGSEEQHCAD
jgi:hypothetical protein